MASKKKTDLSSVYGKSVQSLSTTGNKVSNHGFTNWTQARNDAALRNLQKAREAKKRYYELRKEGFTRENVVEATQAIEGQLQRLSAFKPENNPAVAQLLDEIGGEFPTANSLAAMTNAEYYKYATSLRTFLGDSLSSEVSVNKLMDRVLYEVVGKNLTRKKNERMQAYHRRRKQFIDENADTAREAFRLYRQLESTHAAVILRGKLSPQAYGSDNLITDLFDFIENEYDGDFDKAVSYWQEQLSNQYAWEEQELARLGKGAKLTKFDWTGREKYASFTPSGK